jgi:hypothetical protein
MHFLNETSVCALNLVFHSPFILKPSTVRPAHTYLQVENQQRLKNNKVYECLLDVKLLSEHQQSVNNLLGRFITVKGHLQTFTVS